MQNLVPNQNDMSRIIVSIVSMAYGIPSETSHILKGRMLAVLTPNFQDVMDSVKHKITVSNMDDLRKGYDQVYNEVVNGEILITDLKETKNKIDFLQNANDRLTKELEQVQKGAQGITEIYSKNLQELTDKIAENTELRGRAYKQEAEIKRLCGIIDDHKKEKQAVKPEKEVTQENIWERANRIFDKVQGFCTIKSEMDKSSLCLPSSMQKRKVDLIFTGTQPHELICRIADAVHEAEPAKNTFPILNYDDFKKAIDELKIDIQNWSNLAYDPDKATSWTFQRDCGTFNTNEPDDEEELTPFDIRVKFVTLLQSMLDQVKNELPIPDSWLREYDDIHHNFMEGED